MTSITLIDSPIPVLLFIALVVFYLLRTRYQNHLSAIPGPFLHSFSPFPRLFSVARGHAHFDAIKLHRQYGPLVRVGPNHVSFSDSTALSQVYSAYTKFEKTDFYLPFDAKTPHGWLPTSFSLRSERAHRDVIRPVAAAYSMTNMLDMEGLTDDCITIFQRKLDEKLAANSNRAVEIDLGQWLHWYAFDVITSITFSNRLGFMETESDIDGIIAAIEGRLKYNATVGQAPLLHRFLLRNDSVSWLANQIPAIAKLNTGKRIIEFTAQQLKRYEDKDKETGYADMLDRFKKVKNNGEVQMTDLDVLLAASGNIFAGSDTTAISLRSMFYYLMKNPRCLNILLREIDEKDQQGKLSEIVRFAESQQMPYLQACMKEAMRLHPAVGLLLERIVPEDGIHISGQFIGPGTIVGANPWVVARDKDVYGEDADDFRPERWLDLWRIAERDDAVGGKAKEKVKKMERNFLAFGMGSRSCLGKNVSLLEMNKLVPQLLRRYNFTMDPGIDWRMENYWFVKQLGLVCKLSAKRR